MKISVSPKLSKRLGRYGGPTHLDTLSPFELEEYVPAFQSNSPYIQPVRVSKNKQLDFFDKVYDNPYFGPYTMCIGAAPYDNKALMLAANIFEVAIKQSRTAPKWITSYSVDMRTDMQDRPPLLVLSNLFTDSNNFRIQTVRDFLVKYAKIPKIVVVSGEDPISFMYGRLNSHITGCVFIQEKTAKRVVKSI